MQEDTYISMQEDRGRQGRQGKAGEGRGRQGKAVTRLILLSIYY